MNQDKKVKAYYSERMMLDASIQFIAGTLTGTILVIIGSILGHFIFGTGIAFFKASLLIIPLTFGIIAAFTTILKHIALYRNNRNLPDPTIAYLGESTVTLTFDVMRSPDDTHQLRMTKTDGPEHFHAEVLDPNLFVVLESNVCGEIKPKQLGKGKNRWLAIINQSKVDNIVNHYLGHPPELTGQADNRVLLPKPKILVIEQTGTEVFLFRFTESNAYAGDTWHQSIEEAKTQAEFEYNIPHHAWQQISDEMDGTTILANMM
jgi:F0F1-type ATP synthase assembly protein I